MSHAAAFRDALEAGDVAGLRALHAHVAPHLPAPKDDAEAQVTLHMARTASSAISLKARAWSHRWLTERGLPSQLPDRLKPSAEQICPRKVGAVGISVNFGSGDLAPAGKLIRGAMEDAVNEAYADRRTDPVFVSRRMAEARTREARALFGRWGPAKAGA